LVYTNEVVLDVKENTADLDPVDMEVLRDERTTLRSLFKL